MNFIEHVHEPHRLLLIWQSADGLRTRRAIAELIRPGTGPVRLRYLTDTPDFHAACNEGFFNFPAFRKLALTYDLGVVETFMRRLPPQTRGDYAQYLEKFRLRPETPVSDFALLACTGAKLPSDGFSIIDPLEDIDTRCEMLLEVAGFRHVSPLSVDDIHPGARAQFVAESDNPHDADAVAVHVDGRKTGYVPRQQASAVRRLLQAQAIEATVERVNGSRERPLVYVFARIQPLAIASVPSRWRM